METYISKEAYSLFYETISDVLMLYANEEVPESYMNHMIPELLKLVSKNNQLLTVSVENIFKKRLSLQSFTVVDVAGNCHPSLFGTKATSPLLV